ncbi:MAG: hypothetical protein BAA01_02855 [Bacillus thermozeamaize]|uniref:YIEGIA protein n=1 Tax=Bacillus thermozeamaize TaxID=230954 RepID=A0A1Y3PU90_9BACI|nr:MAG: hypothetical protein BAA01_02855 [Bacillus thermozeamaize]
MAPYQQAVLLGIVLGFLARVYMLRTDYRQYPTYPHGRIIHLALGFIAASLGAVAVPALAERDFTAVTFLTLAAQQFRDVRNMEREMLSKMDRDELVPRGASYIEGIAMVFEGRNYLVILTALLVSMFTYLFHPWMGVVVGFFCLLLDRIFMSGKSIGHIAEIQEAPVHFKGALLYVGDIVIMNVGLSANQNLILEKGLGLILKPKNQDARITLSHLGQRQAILHDATTILGVYRDAGTPALVPMAKLDLEDGRVGIFLLPQDKNIEKAVQLIKRVPILESAVRRPSQAAVNQRR